MRSSRPPSPWCPSPPFPTGGLWAPLTRQPTRDPGVLRATPGPRRGAHTPGQAIPRPPLLPPAPGTPWRGAGPPVLVILSRPPTSRQEDDLRTQRSPRSRASRASPSPQAPLSHPTPLGPPRPMGFHHLRVLPGLGIRHRPGPRPFSICTCTTALGLSAAEIRGSIGSGLVSAHGGLGGDLGGSVRAWKAPGSVTGLPAPVVTSTSWPPQGKGAPSSGAWLQLLWC